MNFQEFLAYYGFSHTDASGYTLAHACQIRFEDMRRVHRDIEEARVEREKMTRKLDKTMKERDAHHALLVAEGTLIPSDKSWCVLCGEHCECPEWLR